MSENVHKTKGNKDISSEKEFKNYFKRGFRNMHSHEWILGSGRGERIFELMNRLSYNFMECRVLDLGCGYGAISLFLCEKTKEVIGVDVNKESVGVAYLRSTVLNKNNFLAVLGSATNIPIRNDSLDFVLIIGVLEWVPHSKPRENPESTQLEVLKEVRRILKRQGMLLLAIENRYYLRYWLGTRDHHSNLRFVPVLPRRIADWVSKREKGEPYLNRTYSYFELRKLVRKIGFKIMKMYIGIPDYIFPEEIAEINNKDEMRQKIDSIRQRKSRRIVWGVINKIGLMKFFSSNFIIVCQK